MTVKFRGEESERFFLNSSSPQGTFLGVFIFVVTFNSAFLRPSIPRLFCGDCESRGGNSDCVHRSNSVFTAKYVDDSSRARAINLITDLSKNPEVTFPARFRERTGHCLKSERNFLQSDIDEFQKFCEQRNHVRNVKKSLVTH